MYQTLYRVQKEIVYQALKPIYKLTLHLTSCLQKQASELHTQQASHLYEAHIIADATTRTFDPSTAAAHITVEA